MPNSSLASSDVDQLAAVGVCRPTKSRSYRPSADLVDHRQQEGAVGAGADRHPFVGDRREAGAHRVDRDEPPAVALELAIAIFSGLEWWSSAVPIITNSFARSRSGRRTPRTSRRSCRSCRRPCSPSRSRRAPRSWACRNWRANRPVSACIWSRPVNSANFFGSVARIFASRSARSRRPPPRRSARTRRPALAARLALERLRQARRRVLLHDPRRALGADHALVQRVVGVAVDVAHLGRPAGGRGCRSGRAHVAPGAARRSVVQRRGGGSLRSHGRQRMLSEKAHNFVRHDRKTESTPAPDAAPARGLRRHRPRRFDARRRRPGGASQSAASTARWPSWRRRSAQLFDRRPPAGAQRERCVAAARAASIVEQAARSRRCSRRRTPRRCARPRASPSASTAAAADLAVGNKWRTRKAR